MNKNSSGQSLVEVIASLGVVILVVAALVNLVTASLRSSNYAKTASQANKYAQEGIEWIRSQRDRALDWESFKSSVLGKKCLKSLALTTYGDCTIGTTIFKREAEAEIITEDENRLKVKITVKWSDQAGEHESKVETILTNTSLW